MSLNYLIKLLIFIKESIIRLIKTLESQQLLIYKCFCSIDGNTI